jgi:ankyrin repeat protein
MSHITRLFLYALVAIFGLVTFSCANAGSIRASDTFPGRREALLADAAGIGKLEEVKKILLGGADINGRGQNGVTILIWTLAHGQKEAFEYLLKAGANPNLQMENGNSALSYAVMIEDTWWLETTIRYGGDPNLYNGESGSALIFDAISARGLGNVNERTTNTVKVLARLGARLDVLNRSGASALHYAVAFNQFDVAYDLLQLGADPMLKTAGGTIMIRLIEADLTLHNSVQYEWRKKVIGLLKAKGITVRGE